jgi:hypothetical protein
MGYNITMGVKEIVWKAVDVINVAQGGEGTGGGMWWVFPAVPRLCRPHTLAK